MAKEAQNDPQIANSKLQLKLRLPYEEVDT